MEFFLFRKSAVVCPIPRARNLITVNDYRPISILPALSKILERVCSTVDRMDHDILIKKVQRYAPFSLGAIMDCIISHGQDPDNQRQMEWF
ncbi:hypothetical protein ALC53_05635 [Atta colombica]|uniref:Uncharacterized protein n=1 Tax=Atta colombica TaxID=520822 RepID=A0A151I4M4_9HYME|nr:hypothetical protein ALC53_05635 [Atta colombica]